MLASCARQGALPEPGPGPEPGDGAPTRVPADIEAIPDAVPRVEASSRYGNPSSYVVFAKRYEVMPSAVGHVERGIASWYGTKFHGRRTSSGEPYDMYAMTAAHKSLPLPTYVSVTNLENGRRVVLRVNDRGPFHDNRIIDLSYTAAVKLGIQRKGTGLVEVRAIDPRQPPAVAAPVPAPTAAAPPVPVRIYLQAGAFTARANAERLAATLEPLGDVPVTLSTTVSAGQVFHRVRLGPLANVDEADALAARVRDAGHDLPRVVLE